MTVTAAEIFCVLGTLVGVGVLGTPVESSSGGALSADATLLAPAGTAFSIWSVIYVGLAAYTVLQWLPGQATSARDRSIGWLVAASMVLNAGWLLVTQQGWIELSVLVIVALLAVLVAVVRRLDRLPAHGAVDRVVRDATFGLYLGWVAVASFANVAAVLAASSLTAPEPVVVAAALAGLVAVVALHLFVARLVGPRWTVVGATAWGLVWVTVGRLTDTPESLLVGIGAAVAAVAVLAIPLTARRDRAARA
ncbi:tryptophan-rich sensory protein [Nocardioides sp. HDW12B]|nr:tryptophan-rich sensory protein [Nocardioides sp. HDW12B]